MLIYRLILTLLTPAFALLFLWRWLTGREDGAALAARLGRVAPGGPSLWLHAASNGELTSVRPVIYALREARPDLAVYVTCNTQTGRDLARGWGLEAELAPLDLKWAADKILRRRSVVAHVTVESELWPNRLTACQARNVPVAVIGARLTERTAKGWARFPGIRDKVASVPALVVPQDAGSAARLKAFGIADAALAPVQDLKTGVTKWSAEELADPALDAALPRNETWLAASTHEGEDDIVLDAHRRITASRPGTRLILAPRHPRRAGDIAALIDAAGFSHTRRSEGLPGRDVFLADTMGEMPHWYSRAAVTFVAGSLTDRGGHTPHEPIAYGSPVLHGPHVGNFSDAYAKLDAANAARSVTDAQTLAEAALETLDPEENRRMIAAAEALSTDETPAADTVRRLLQILPG